MLVVLFQNLLSDESKKRIFLEKAKELKEYVKQEPGNKGFDILESKENPLNITLCEMYADEVAIAAHSSMEYAQRYFAELIAISTEHSVNVLQYAAENN